MKYRIKTIFDNGCIYIGQNIFTDYDEAKKAKEYADILLPDEYHEVIEVDDNVLQQQHP